MAWGKWELDMGHRMGVGYQGMGSSVLGASFYEVGMGKHSSARVMMGRISRFGFDLFVFVLCCDVVWGGLKYFGTLTA